MSRLRKRPDWGLVLLLALSVFAVAPLFSPGYFFDAHDADHSVFFLVQFDAAIRDGALWPRWGPDHALGFGYPVWVIYAPLAYFAAEAFHLAGLGFTAAVKAVWILAFLLGGWGMYALLRRWWSRSTEQEAAGGNGRLTPASGLGPAVALVGALIYVYAPYHLLDVYVRAALAEFAAMAFFPWVFLAFDDLVEQGGLRQMAVAALAFAGLLLTHTGTIVPFTPLLVLYLAFAVLRRAYLAATRPLSRQVQEAGDAEQTLTALGLSSPLPIGWRAAWHSGLQVAAAGLLALGLAAIFLVPMLLEQRYIEQSQWVQGTYGYRLHFVFANQFLDPFWGYGFSDDPLGPKDGMSFQLGIVAVMLGLTALVVGLRRRSPQRSTTLFFLLATLVLLLLMMPLSQPLWDAFAPAALIQFPWRLLGLVSFTLAIAAAAAAGNLLAVAAVATGDGTGRQPAHGDAQPAFAPGIGWRIHPAAYVLALVAILASLPYTLPQFTDITPTDESARAIIRFETEYPDMIGVTAYSDVAPVDTPLVDQYLSGQPLEKATLVAGSGRVETVRVGGASVTARVEADGPATVMFYTYDFPGWRATLDGQRVAHRYQPPYGLIAVDVPAGQHTLTIRHGATVASAVGTAISLLSVLIVLALLWRDRAGRQRTAPGASSS